MKPTIALCMMVRNEEMVIQRAIRSALPYVQAVSVSDTGSTDATEERVFSVVGWTDTRVYRHEWENFGVNRTHAFNAAREMGTDYILVMDADQELQVSDPGELSSLTADAYNLMIHHGQLRYPHPWLLKASMPWRWEGPTHEYLTCDAPFTVASLTDVTLLEHADSHRRRTGAKLSEDKALLEAAYRDDPSNPRTVFYLGQCCQDAGTLPCAITWYQRRVAMGGWQEEVWCAQYRTARCLQQLQQLQPAIAAYLHAYELAPSRAESLFWLGTLHLTRGELSIARLYLDQASAIEPAANALFLEQWIYDYGAEEAYAQCCRALGAHIDAQYHEDRLLAAESTPKMVIDRIIQNRLISSKGSLD